MALNSSAEGRDALLTLRFFLCTNSLSRSGTTWIARETTCWAWRDWLRTSLQRSPTSWSLTWRAEALNQTPSRRPTPLAPNLRATPSEPAGARQIPDVWQPFKGPFTNLNPAKSADAVTPCWFWRGYRSASPSEGGRGVKGTFRCLLSNLLSKMVMWWIASKPVERAHLKAYIY